MLELLCPLSPALIDAEHMISPLLSLLCELPDFTPSRYDLNQHGSWRTFDSEKTCVDALSQRVQLLRVQGKDPGHLAMLSLGKLGEEPALVVRTPEAPIEALCQALSAHVDDIPMQWLVVTSQAWREALPDTSTPPLSPLMAIPNTLPPSRLPALAQHTLERATILLLATSFASPPTGARLAELRAHITAP